MSFLFGKKNKQQTTGLPPASRNIGSSHGPGSQIPTANGSSGPDPEKSRGPQAAGTPTPGASVNNSLSSLQNAGNPEPKALRERSDSDFQVRVFNKTHSKTPSRLMFAYDERHTAHDPK
jgi:hypothetical protein